MISVSASNCATVRTSGYEALDAKAQKILDDAPGFVFTADGPVRVTPNLGYLAAWNFGPEGAALVVRGADIALVADGLITSVHTLPLAD